MININALFLCQVLYLSAVEVQSQDCADARAYRHNGKDYKTCMWIGEKNRRAAKLCKEADVLSSCKLTCGVCCHDNAGSFAINSNEKRQCSWLSNETKKKYCEDKNVRVLCPRSCGLCCLNDETYKFHSQFGSMNMYRRLNRKHHTSKNFVAIGKDRYSAACGHVAQPSYNLIASTKPSAGPSVIPSRSLYSNPSTSPANQLSDLTQKEVLEIIYKKTGGDQWYDNTGWSSDLKECNWYGVVCFDGIVTKVILGGN